MSPKELKTLIKTLRSLGVISYESEGVKLLLDPAFNGAIKGPKTSKKRVVKDTADIQEQINGLIPQMTDEQWLLATNAPSAEDEQVQ